MEVKYGRFTHSIVSFHVLCTDFSFNAKYFVLHTRHWKDSSQQISWQSPGGAYVQVGNTMETLVFFQLE